jgi:hypothetical protein
VYPKLIKEKGDGKALDGFLKVLTVITGALTSIILVQAL